MPMKFVIEDEAHSEWISEHLSLAEAEEELRRLAALPWDQAPNVAPRGSWRTCGRRYELMEYDTASEPWTLVRRVPAFEINAAGLKWTTAEDGEASI